MANLAEIALRRLDGAYFDSTDDSSPSYEERYIVALLGIEFDGEGLSAFEAASELARARFISALEAQLPASMVTSIRRRAKNIRSGSELKRTLIQSAPEPKELKIVTDSELQSLFERLITQPLPYSEQDLVDLRGLADRFDAGSLQASARENNAVLAGLIPGYDWSRSMTMTDALRIAAVWSGGDQTLEVPTKFKLKRSQRRALCLALETVVAKSPYAYMDIARHREPWKRLFGALHVGDYPVPELQAAAKLLFEDQLISVDALIEHMIRERDFEGLLIHLRTMPGVFARRLHELIRKMPDRRNEIVGEFSKHADRVSTRVLIQLRNYFSGPGAAEAPNLPFAGKSRSARNGFLENRKSGDYSDVVSAVDTALSTKLSGKNVYLADGGDSIGAMTSNRSTSQGARVVAPGSRIPVGDDPEFVTMFTHWRDIPGGGTVDLDVSALFLTDDLHYSETVSYYSTGSAHARYSGDIVSAPDGAEEYISVDLKHARSRGFRYMAILIHSYSGQSIGSIPECYAGIAVSESLDFGSFDAAAVEARFDLTAQGREVIPFLLDLETLELIWVDMAFKGASQGANLSGSTSIGSLLSYIVSYQGLTVGDFLDKSGANRVKDPKDADISVDARMSDQVAQLLS